MYELDPVHVKRHGTFVYCQNITADNAKVVIETEINNEQTSECNVVVRQKLLSEEEKTLYQLEKSLTIEALGENNITFEFDVKNPSIWELDSTYLYKMVTEIVSENAIVDQYETTFGIRDVQYTEQGLVLNGKLTEIKGVCEHQDFAGVGVALTPDIIDYKLTRIKEMGGNAYRSAHHPAY
jgi:beta-galactosidase